MKRKNFMVVLDAGHGGADSGAVGKTGLLEKHVALIVVRRMAKILGDLKVPVVLTRSDDTFIELYERARIAYEVGATLFVSIHCNAGGGKGFEVFTSPGQTDSDLAASHLFQAYAAEFPQLVERTDLSDGDVDKEAKFAVLTRTKGAAVLFELEFIDTPEGESFLRNSENQKRMAKALADGVLSYLGVQSAGARKPAEPSCDDLDTGKSNIAKACDLINEALKLLG